MENPTNIPTEPEMPEVQAGKKRSFPEDFRRQAVAYYDSLPNDGSKGAYLRRSGVYSSSITEWRKALQNGVNATTSAPGRRPADKLVRENAELKAALAKTQAQLERANTVIEVQKKVTSLLEMHLDQAEQAS